MDLPSSSPDARFGLDRKASLKARLALDGGGALSQVDIAYETYGTLNADGSNAILICHALTGDQHVASNHSITGKPGWWTRMVGAGKPIDTDRFCVVSSNVIGGCMGSSGPQSIGPDGKPVQALQDVSLEIGKGELVSILGPSGCGKTTLLNILAGFLSPTSGKVTLNGHAVTGPHPERGMVFQQGALFEWMSVRRNVDFGPRMKGMGLAERTKITDHLLETVGLHDFKEKAVYELSGGMQQRVALARCLANDPDVILMDEPLGALDALTREKMQGLVLKLWKETGKTVILITHSVEEALLLGERLIVMAPRPGRIFKEYSLPFAERGVGADLRIVKRSDGFAETREEILGMIWGMEEEIMGRAERAS